MRSISLLLVATASLAGCSYTKQDLPDRGVAAVNVPVVTRADYVFDAAAPGGTMAPSDTARLDAWFRGLDIGYGDSVYVDAPYGDTARYEVAQVAGKYGMLLQPGAPVTAGAVAPGNIRVIVSRTRAEVPNCPNWSRPAQPNQENRMLSNFGCGVNANLAAMVANPEDLVHGREAAGVGDPLTSNKAVNTYRSTEPSGKKGLQSVSSKGN